MDGLLSDYEDAIGRADERSSMADCSMDGESGGLHQLSAQSAEAPLARVYRLAGKEMAMLAAGLVVVDQLADLQTKGFLEPHHVDAGMRWRKDWLAYVEGVIETETKGGGAGCAHTSQLARAAAGERLRSVRMVIGMSAETVLVMLLIRDMSGTAIAAAILPTAKPATGCGMARGKCVAVVEALAAAYELIDSQRRKRSQVR